MKFEEILKSTQKELINKLTDFLKEKGYNKILKTENYVFAEGVTPIMLLAHMDTVHADIPKEIYYDKDADVMWSPQGIGGDDRCGIYAITQIINKTKHRPYILFTTEEEKGGLGAKKFVEEFLYELKNRIKFLIQIDRRGNKQAIFYKCDNKDFHNYILSFGLKREYGSFTDICTLSPAYDIASVNLSAGYYNEHTKQEIIKLKDLKNTIEIIINILDDDRNQEKFFDYQEAKYSYSNYYNSNYYSNYSKETNIKDYTKSEKKKEEKEKKEDEIEEVEEVEEKEEMLEFSDEFIELLIEDYNNLSNEEFFDYYGYNKPQTLKELLSYYE